jgi:flavin-dependent dehydrogenase
LPAYNIKREVFDAFLLDLVKQHTPTKILTGIELKEIKQGNPFTLISKDDTINTKFIIGCDGAGSATSHCLGHEVMVKPEKVMAVRAYYKGINLSSDTNHFYVLKKYLPGYFWIFPLGEDMFNVGFGMKTNKQGKTTLKMKDVLGEITAHPRLANIFHGAEQLSDVKGSLIPIGGRKGSYSGDGFLLAGDAAFLADPLQGHGIDKAVVSGMLAGLHAQSCFKEDDYSSSKNYEYDLMIRNGIEKELRKNRMRQQILRNFPSILSMYAMLKK